jgi:hypothetical protein
MATVTPSASTLRARPVTYAGLFVVTLTTLMYEIVLTRIFSVAMWYHFAFVAISIALFGMTAGALIVHLRPQWFRDEVVKRQMWRFSLAYGLSVAGAFIVQLAIPFVPKFTMAGLSSIALTCVVISVPFVCSGVVVCLALTRFPGRVNRLYAADLVGAGLGCVLLVVLFWWLDGPSLVVGIGALGCLAAVLFAFDAGLRPNRKVLSVVALATLVIVTGFNSYRHSQGNPFIRILWAKEEQDTLHSHDRWNAFSRITVDGQPTDVGVPAGYGMSPEMPEDMTVPQMSMLIDGTAGTMLTGYDGDEETTDFLRYDITNLGYYALDGSGFRSAVIGVGGGRDVLTGLEFGADDVTGIEINGNILDLDTDELGDFTNLTDDPRVNLVNDEARSWLTRTDERFDMIQMSLIDTWAASSAGAFALTENSLYTTDSWQTFLDRLAPGGMLSVSRWYSIGGREPFETLRTAALATEVLTRNGVENPRDHVLIFKGPAQSFASSAATILVSPDGFDRRSLSSIERNAERLGFETILTPTEVADDRFADIVAPGGPDAGIAQFDEDLSPPTDDRPFFFQMASLDTFLSGGGFSDDLVFRPVLVLGSLALAVLVLAGIFIGGPLVSMGRRVKHEGGHRGMGPFYLYFACIGLGFMLVEFSQLQRLSTFLGHPTYALAVVLFSLLLFSGLGSMLVERVINVDRPRSLWVPLGVLLVVLAVFGSITNAATEAAAGGTTPMRIGVAVGLLAPLALVMGMPFSIGMGAASRQAGAPTAFLWGINGATSVVASVTGALVAMFFGISVTFASGFVAYALGAVALWLIVRRLVASGQEPAPSEAAEEDEGELVTVPANGNGNATEAEPESEPVDVID